MIKMPQVQNFLTNLKKFVASFFCFYVIKYLLKVFFDRIFEILQGSFPESFR